MKPLLKPQIYYNLTYYSGIAFFTLAYIFYFEFINRGIADYSIKILKGFHILIIDGVYHVIRAYSVNEGLGTLFDADHQNTFLGIIKIELFPRRLFNGYYRHAGP